MAQDKLMKNCHFTTNLTRGIRYAFIDTQETDYGIVKRIYIHVGRDTQKQRDSF